MSPQVVCVGLATLDAIFALPRHPGQDDRVVADELAVAGGGPAATAAVALARLGVDVAFVGAVGDDDAGAEISDGLAAEGVDVSDLTVVPGARSPAARSSSTARSAAIVHYPGTVTLEPSASAVERMRAAEWVHVDHAGYTCTPDGVRLSVDGGNPTPGLDLSRVALYAPSGDRIRRRPAGDRRRARRRHPRRGGLHRYPRRRRRPRGARRADRRPRQHARCRRRLPRRPARSIRAWPRASRRTLVREPCRRTLLPRARRALGDPDAGGGRMTHRIAVIPGDGAGPEVVAEARKAVDALGLDVDWNELPWGSAHYHEHRRDDAGRRARRRPRPRRRPARCGRRSLRARPRLALGLAAAAPPGTRPLGEPPARAPARGDPLAARRLTAGRHALRPREHRGRVLGRRRPRAHGLPHEVGIETASSRARACARVVKYAFELAETRRKRLTSATKSNASRYGYVLWDEVVEEVAAEHPDVTVERALVDALAARMVTQPAQPRRRRRLEPVRRRADRHRRRAPGRDGHGRERQRRPRLRDDRDLRACARLGARTSPARAREPARRDLECGADARAPRRGRTQRPG